MTSSSMSLDAYVAAGTPLIIICAGFVAVRCFVNFRVYKRLLVDDYASILGLAFVTIAFSMNDIIIQRFTDPMNSLNWLNHFAVIITLIVAFELWTTKIPILLVYVKIFGINKTLRYCSYTTIAVSGVIYICAMSPTFMRCDPKSKSATITDLEICTTGTTLTGVISGFIALAEDVLIFSLPMPLVRGLHLPTKKRLAVGAVFFSGILGIAASTVSLYFKYKAYQGTTSDTLATMLCAVIEGTIAIMVGCAPSVKSLWSIVLSPRIHSSFMSTSSGYDNYSQPIHAYRRSYRDDEYKLMDSPVANITPLKPVQTSG